MVYKTERGACICIQSLKVSTLHRPLLQRLKLLVSYCTSLWTCHIEPLGFLPTLQSKTAPAVKMNEFYWCTAIFTSCHSLHWIKAGAFTLPISNTFKLFPLNHLSVCFSIIVPEVEALSTKDWTSLSSGNFLHLAPSIISTILTSFPVPADEKPPHSIMLHCGMVFLGWWEVLGLAFSLMAKKLNTWLIWGSTYRLQ